MGNDCSTLSDCADYITGKSNRQLINDGQIQYEDNGKAEKPKKMQLRKREQSYSEPTLDSFEQTIKVQQIVSGIPQEFLKLYEFGKLLGVGTTSKVYQIFHKRRKYVGHRTPFACKIIDKRKLTMGMMEEDVDPLLQQLRKEVDILRRINHPHVVAFQDFVETKQLLFIITEYLPGGELFDYILKHGPLPEDLACKSLYGIFSAVAYLHDRGVIHRDIKAENVIFFHKVNGEISLKLIDFGFSTILKHDLTGSFLGTGGYIAPEIRQNKQYSMSVDNWALGVLLYCTMSAKLPFSISLDALPADRLECSEHFKLRFPSKQWIGVSEICKDLIRQLLTIDPFVRLAAKEALLHPWFRPVRPHKKHSNKSTPSSIQHTHHQTLHYHSKTTSPHHLKDEAIAQTRDSYMLETNRLSSEQDDSGNTSSTQSASRYYQVVNNQHSDTENDLETVEDGETESEGSETYSVGHENHKDEVSARRRGRPLRKLHNSELRPVQSMIQLERKHQRYRPELLSPNASTSSSSSQQFIQHGHNHGHHSSNSSNNQQDTATSESPSLHHRHVHHDVHLASHPSRVIEPEDLLNNTNNNRSEDTVETPSTLAKKVAPVWENLSPILISDMVVLTEALNDDAHVPFTPKTEESPSSSKRTPRDIIHSKLFQDQAKLPSIHISPTQQSLQRSRYSPNQPKISTHKAKDKNSNTHAYDETDMNQEMSSVHSSQTDDSDTAASGHQQEVDKTSTSLSEHFTMSSHELASLPNTLWWRSTMTDSTFVQEEIHDKLAGSLFYYTYIPLNAAMR